MTESFYFWLIAFSTMLLLNIQWFRVVTVLKKNGFKSSYFFGYFSDIRNMRKLIKATPDQKIKKRYSRMLTSMLLLNAVIVLLVIITMVFS